ncbi:MAG: hypothetical protein SWK76_12585 [Actinomycetota bacterium]|nr:hypothetical protein [Actinomycetota bacterium]
MNGQNVVAFIYMGLLAIGGAGIIVGNWTVINKSLKGADKLPGIQDHDQFMQAMRGFLDARLSRNPVYSANPPRSNLELYEFYRKWMIQSLAENTWKAAAIAVAVQLIGGLFIIRGYYEDLSMGIALIFLFSCTVVVAAISLLFVYFIDKRKKLLGIIDKHFNEMIAPDRAALAQISSEEYHQQAYRLGAISAIPVLTTNEDIAAKPRSISEASFIVRGGVAFIAGLGFFLCMVFLGVALAESIFPVFLFTGLIGIPVIWFSLLVFWEARKKESC